MAFKSDSFAPKAAANPAAHFKTLTKREFPDVMPHQKEMLEAYGADFKDFADVALQLPTGSGKTLVGLLIADWRRRRFGDRAVYLCPTKQLVRQTVHQAHRQYGIDVVDLSGSKSDFTPDDKTAFKRGQKVAVSTYSGLFNTNPFFESPDLVIIDDAHAAENYIANMWSLSIPGRSDLYSAMVEFLRPHIGSQTYARMTGDWSGPADSLWVDKLPTDLVDRHCAEIEQIVDAHATRDKPELYYTWSLLRENFDACHVYLSAKEILIRPLIPPTFTHEPFSGAKQRIYMSATLGGGGDLERLTGRPSIKRLAAPEAFQTAGVGRRFFIFPSLSFNDDDSDALRLAMQARAGRSVVLTPSTGQAAEHTEKVQECLEGFTVFSKDDIEDDKTPFVSSDKAVAILANRYDGIDFPGDECRLLCVDGLPKAMNVQERFLMSKLGASALYNDRVQTRILQAMGRCTRALQDRSAVVVTGTELVDYLADDRKWKHFPSELQAELTFGVEQSSNVSKEDVLDNFEMFMVNDTGWGSADSVIRDAIDNFAQDEFPAMNDLGSVVSQEISYQQAMWNKDYSLALATARAILGKLNNESLRGYRALWHYLAGSAALRLSKAAGDAQAQAAGEQFRAAKRAAPSVSWLNSLVGSLEASESSEEDVRGEETHRQVETIMDNFMLMGTATNHKFEKKAAKISDQLSDAKNFEIALVELGTLLGFTAGNDESDAAPDPWWLGFKVGIVFEAHAGGEDSTVFGATKARQAAGHPKWLKKMVPGTAEMELVPILITPCKKVKSGAVPHLEDVRYWELSKFREWAIHAIAVLRELKGTYPGEADLAWRAEAASRLETESLTLGGMLRALPSASISMEIVP